MLKVYGFSRVNNVARGNTRDLRVLWALEEMALPFEVVGMDHPNHDLDTPAYRAGTRSGRFRRLTTTPWSSPSPGRSFQRHCELQERACSRDALVYTLPPMGLLATRWEATFERHNLTVNRNEVGRGFALEWDGTEIARRSWSWIGLGELHGTAEVDGKHHDVKVVLEWAGFSELDGKCTITVDGTPIPVKHIR